MNTLFLSQILSSIKNPQKIYFNYFFFEPNFSSLNIWAEYELQSKLNPLLGLNSFVKRGAYCIEAYNHEFFPNMK
jgi:hypothetical protein